MKQLILGGARSGKSRLAEARAQASGSAVVYIATANAQDAEMEQRIQLHKQQRPSSWALVEEPYELTECLAQLSGQGQLVLVDCLTLWQTNHLLRDQNSLQEQRQKLVSEVAKFEGELILVSNEVGWGIVPMGELSRIFQDEAGRLHQDLAQVVERVTLTVAGLPLEIKGA